MIRDMKEKLEGSKSYIMAIAGATLTVIYMLGFLTPQEYAGAIGLAGCGYGVAMRAALEKAGF